jgi:outer membrane protein assembly factor BamB
MNPDPAPSESQEQVPKNANVRRHRPNRMSFICSILAFAMIVLVPVVRGAIEDVDRQYANFAGIAFGLLALLFAQLAIASHGSVHWLLKIGVFVLPPVLLLGFLANYEFAGFNGEVWPTFRPRGDSARAKKDRNIVPTRSEQSTTVVPSPQLPYRFAQFLGNQRNGVVDENEFSMLWDQKLPAIAWRRDIGEGWSGFAIANGLAITLFQREDKEIVAALNLKTGETVWEQSVPGRHANALGGIGPRSTPTIASISSSSREASSGNVDADASKSREVVIAQTALGMVLCLDAGSGEVIWSLNLLERASIDQVQAEKAVMWGRSGSPLIVDDMVVVPLGGGKESASAMKSLIALDIATGEERWVGGKTQISYASPALLTLDGVRQIVSVNEGNVTGHDIATGEVLWESAWPSKSDGDACASQPVQVDSNRILLGKGYAQGSKLILVQKPEESDSNQQARWQSYDQWADTRTLKTKFTNAIVFEGKAYALSDGILECVDPADGVRVWRGKRYGQGQILVVNGAILVSAEDGRVVSVDRESGKPIAEMQVLEGITWNTPAIAGPFLLVRNASEVVCLLSPKE